MGSPGALSTLVMQGKDRSLVRGLICLILSIIALGVGLFTLNPWLLLAGAALVALGVVLVRKGWRAAWHEDEPDARR
jgi:hypothetical protein